jgi:hypothetical protein
MRTTSSTVTTPSPAPGWRWARRFAGRNLWPPLLLAWLALLYADALVACIVPFGLLPVAWALRRYGFRAAAARCLDVVAATGAFWLVVAAWWIWLK